jgi:hypothetical protein
MRFYYMTISQNADDVRLLTKRLRFRGGGGTPSWVGLTVLAAEGTSALQYLALHPSFLLGIRCGYAKPVLGG